MTKKEMENAIRNLQSAVSSLAAKAYSRNSDTKDDVAKVSGDIAEVGAKADETAIQTTFNTNGISDLETALMEISEIIYQ